MSIYRVIRAVADASGEGPIDWAAAAEGAKAAIDPGSLDLAQADRGGYARDTRDARDRLRAVSGLEFDLPSTVELHDRHHWIDANVGTFERLMAPLAEESVPGVARTVNTGTMTVMLAFLGNNVLGQYDPLLLAEDDHALYYVDPNIRKVADALDVPFPRFRRWIAFHEVAHAAEFGAAPWLPEHLESRMRTGVDALLDGEFDRQSLKELDTAMTAVEGYAELVMDRAFDQEYVDLRAKLDARRQNAGPIGQLIRRLLGMGMKRRQYERGKAFFDAVADARGVETASLVWKRPGNLPSAAELDNPELWIRRVA
ncbi:zinc-dependent metalloprotease [Natronomonas sp. EA1]|uniref:zinc-dependent metalloprotease n=1 Tax=Natronomonas sp. EA1 TaxID=3421655 RepID=UPI003EBF3677